MLGLGGSQLKAKVYWNAGAHVARAIVIPRQTRVACCATQVSFIIQFATWIRFRPVVSLWAANTRTHVLSLAPRKCRSHFLENDVRCSVLQVFCSTEISLNCFRESLAPACPQKSRGYNRSALSEIRTLGPQFVLYMARWETPVDENAEAFRLPVGFTGVLLWSSGREEVAALGVQLVAT